MRFQVMKSNNIIATQKLYLNELLDLIFKDQIYHACSLLCSNFLFERTFLVKRKISVCYKQLSIKPLNFTAD